MNNQKTNTHGGERAGAGRKKNTVKKVKLGWRVSEEAKENIEKLASEKEYTASEFADYLMRNQKKAPETLD